MMPSLNACADDAATINPIVTTIAAIDLLITEVLSLVTGCLDWPQLRSVWPSLLSWVHTPNAAFLSVDADSATEATMITPSMMSCT